MPEGTTPAGQHRDGYIAVRKNELAEAIAGASGDAAMADV